MITTNAMPPSYNHAKAVKQEHTSVTTAPPVAAQQTFSQDRAMSDVGNVSQNSINSSSSSEQPYDRSAVPEFSYSQGKEKVKKPKMFSPARKRQNPKVAQERPKGNSVTARRQKRLERNRESARLSRRRRKQYLGVLEDRVKQLSIETDQGRRDHAARAIQTILEKRQNIVQNNPVLGSLSELDVPLNRTSSELLVLSTFCMQQLKSLSLPPHSKFILWLTLQGDTYFRGGRASSERLSAARIGERMLISGNDKASPASAMWPLVCNEVALSYDQEERVRNFQRTLLQTPSTWLDRHTARASGFVTQSFHDSLNAVAQSIRQRDHSTSKGLTAEQRLKFACWAERNSDGIKAKLAKKRQEIAKAKEAEEIQLSKSHHVAANLYILNHRLQKLMSALPKHPITFTQAALKRLSRRPSFESLGQRKQDGEKEDGEDGLTREGSFASSGSLKSLKRSSSSLSMDDPDKPHPQQVRPEDGQKEAEATLEKELGFIKSIIPPSRTPTAPAQPAPVALPAAPIPSYHPPYAAQQPPRPEAPVSNPHYQRHNPMHYASTMPPHTGAPPMQSHQYPPVYAGSQHPQHYYPPQQQAFENSNPVLTYNQAQSAQEGGQISQEMQSMQSHQAKTHVRKSSFLPRDLSAVPEEMFPSGDGAAEDFFISLINDEDWAIGEGIDMDS